MRSQENRRSAIICALLVLTMLSCCEGRFIVVEIKGSTHPSVRMAVQACVGLFNGRYKNDNTSLSAYTYFNKTRDSKWLDLLSDELGTPSEIISDANVFIKDYCLVEFKSCVTYSFQSQQALLPNIITVAAVLEAVPLDRTTISDTLCGNVVFDAIAEFRKPLDTPVEATRFVYNNYALETTGLAMINPGYQHDGEECWDPPLQNRVNGENLIDYAFSRKLFTIFLVNACIPLTDDNDLFEHITEENPWKQSPIPVYGYAQYWKVFEGDVFEAQTRCVSSRNLGAVPSLTPNLSFFSTRRDPITSMVNIPANNDDGGDLLIRNKKTQDDISYDPTKTYVAFVVGDGDNVSFMMSTRREWFLQRLKFCETDPTTCAKATLSWSISPHLPYLAPDVLEWYYKSAAVTGQDFFILPPSGHLYAYPTSFAKEARDDFIAATEADARLLNVKSTVHWDCLWRWQYLTTRSAIDTVLPQYAINGDIQGIFPVNVPFMFPISTLWYGKRFKVLGAPGGGNGRVVLFHPRNWRGVDGVEDWTPTPEAMAQELGSFKRGTVTYVYMTSDGGLTLENAFLAMAKLLPDHVQLVSADTATRLALEAHDADSSWWGTFGRSATNFFGY